MSDITNKITNEDEYNDKYLVIKDTNQSLYEKLRLIESFAKEILHDLSSNFFNIYLGYELLSIPSNTSTSNDLNEMLNQSLETFRKQMECYKSIYSHDYPKIIHCMNEYFFTSGIKIHWINEEDFQITLEELWLSMFLLFLKKKLTQETNIVIEKNIIQNKFSIKITVSKIITFQENDRNFLLEPLFKPECAFLSIFGIIAVHEKLQIKLEEKDEKTAIEIYKNS